VGAAAAAIAPSICGFRRSYKGKTARRQCAIHDSWRIKKSEFALNPDLPGRTMKRGKILDRNWCENCSSEKKVPINQRLNQNANAFGMANCPVIKIKQQNQLVR